MDTLDWLGPLNKIEVLLAEKACVSPVTLAEELIDAIYVATGIGRCSTGERLILINSDNNIVRVSPEMERSLCKHLG